MSLSSSRAELLSRAASRSPARDIGSPARDIASGVEGRGAHPRAADEQLVGGGQGVCVLPESKGGRVYNGGRGACWEAGERVRGGSDGMHARGPTLKRLGAKGTRGAHVEHAVHGRDSGGVKAQRLVEGRRVLPSRTEGMRCGGGEVRAGWREGLGCGGGTTRGMHGARLKAGGQGHARRAHLEHPAHGRDAGGVKAQRLVEGVRFLPSRREGMRCGGERCEPEGGRAWGVVAARQEACTGKRPDSRPGGQGHARSARRTCLACQ